MTRTVVWSSISIYSVIAISLVAAKAIGIFPWSWWLALLPFIALAVVIAVIVIVVLCFAVVGAFIIHFEDADEDWDDHRPEYHWPHTPGWFL